MSMWTDWFIADPADAEAIAATVSEDRDKAEWPHLELSGVIESSLMALWGVLKGTPGEWADIVGESLHQVGEADEHGVGPDGMVLVTRVDTDFIAALEGLTDNEVAAHAKTWIKDESMEGWKLKDAKDTLRAMADFAKRAKVAGKPVLELVVV